MGVSRFNSMKKKKVYPTKKVTGKTSTIDLYRSNHVHWSNLHSVDIEKLDVPTLST